LHNIPAQNLPFLQILPTAVSFLSRLSFWIETLSGVTVHWFLFSVYTVASFVFWFRAIKIFSPCAFQLMHAKHCVIILNKQKKQT